MQEINLEFNEDHLKTQKEIISFKCELNENLQQAMKDFMDKHPHWDQFRLECQIGSKSYSTWLRKDFHFSQRKSRALRMHS